MWVFSIGFPCHGTRGTLKKHTVGWISAIRQRLQPFVSSVCFASEVCSQTCMAQGRRRATQIKITTTIKTTKEKVKEQEKRQIHNKIYTHTESDNLVNKSTVNLPATTCPDSVPQAHNTFHAQRSRLKYPTTPKTPVLKVEYLGCQTVEHLEHTAGPSDLSSFLQKVRNKYSGILLGSYQHLGPRPSSGIPGVPFLRRLQTSQFKATSG